MATKKGQKHIRLNGPRRVGRSICLFFSPNSMYMHYWGWGKYPVVWQVNHVIKMKRVGYLEGYQDLLISQRNWWVGPTCVTPHPNISYSSSSSSSSMWPIYGRTSPMLPYSHFQKTYQNVHEKIIQKYKWVDDANMHAHAKFDKINK